MSKKTRVRGGVKKARAKNVRAERPVQKEIARAAERAGIESRTVSVVSVPATEVLDWVESADSLRDNILNAWIAVENLTNEATAAIHLWRAAEGRREDLARDTRYDEIEEHRNQAVDNLRLLTENAGFNARRMRQAVSRAEASR